MRAIARSPLLLRTFQFSNLKMNKVIQERLDLLNKQQTCNYVQYEEVFFKLYHHQLQSDQKVRREIDQIKAICLVDSFPCKAILQHFMKTCKQYSELYVVQTVHMLAKAYRISQLDNSHSGDYSVGRLFFTPAFDHLIEEVKYGFRNERAMSWENMLLVGECLLELGYVDYEIFSIILNAIEKKINKKERHEDEIRLFQIEKEGYYPKSLRGTHRSIVSNEEFQGAMKLLAEKVNARDAHELSGQSLQGLTETFNFSTEEELDEVHALIDELGVSIGQVRELNSDIDKLINAVITIRRQYRKMVRLSESEVVLRNPELNLSMLQLEESLLTKGLIDISDILEPGLIEDSAKETENVIRVLSALIQDKTHTSLDDVLKMAYESENEGSAHKNQSFLEQVKRSKQSGLVHQKNKGICRAFNLLAKFAQAPKRLKNTPDGRSLLTMKWERTLVKPNQRLQQDDESLENLHTEAIFNRQFKDLQLMFKENYSIVMFTFIEESLRQKIEFYEFLTRIGMHGEIVNLFKDSDASNEPISAYSKSQFASLLKVMNDVSKFTKQDSIKEQIATRLIATYVEERREGEGLNDESMNSLPDCTLEFYINAVNYLAQNYPEISNVEMKSAQDPKSKVQQVYNRLVQIIAQKVAYLEESEGFLIEPNLETAYQLLALEMPSKFTFGKEFYQKYGVDTNDKSQLEDFLWRKNPFLFVLGETARNLVPSSAFEKELPYIQTGFNSEGAMTGVLIVSSDQSSLDGKYFSGNVLANIARFERDSEVKVTPFSVNSVITADFAGKRSERLLEFRPRGEISSILSEVLREDQRSLEDFAESIIEIVEMTQRQYKDTFHAHSIQKLLSRLNEIMRLHKQNRQIFSEHLNRIRKYRIWVLLDSLKQDYSIIHHSVRDNFSRLLRKNSLKTHSGAPRKAQSESSAEGDSVIEAIESIKSELLGGLDSNRTPAKEKTRSFGFEGKRFTIQTISEEAPHLSAEALGHELINCTVLNDMAFCPYRQWSESIQSLYEYQALKVSQCSNLGQVLIKRFIPTLSEEIHVLPINKRSEVRQPEFEVTSLAVTKSAEQSETSLDGKNVEAISELMKFVHELKITMTAPELLEYLTSFSFTNKLLHPDPELAEVSTLPRDPNDYLNALELQNSKLYLGSPHLENLFREIQRSEEVKELYQQRSQLKSKLKIEYSLGKISRKQYFERIQHMEDRIIESMKKFQNKLLDQVENNILLKGLKMISKEKDEEQISRVLNQAKYYDKYLDNDYLYANGDVRRVLRIKRKKAEDGFILLFILKKIMSNSESLLANNLNEAQMSFLVTKADLIRAQVTGPSKQQFSSIYNEKYTRLRVRDLSEDDRSKLKLKNSDLNNFPDMALTDILLELHSLIDTKATEDYFHRHVVSQYYCKEHGIPPEVFSVGSNKEFSQLSRVVEQKMVNDSTKLDDYEKDILGRMIKTFKTESFTGKERFGEFYETFDEDLETFNKSEARVEILSEYLYQKEREYNDDFNPKLVQNIKERQVNKLWEIVFRSKYELTDSEAIRKSVVKLCQRIALFNARLTSDVASDSSEGFCPPFFGLLVLKILSHPQTDALTKENLIACIQLYKVTLRIDSEEIRRLGFSLSDKESSAMNSSQKVIQRMKQISNSNVSATLSQKMSLII